MSPLLALALTCQLSSLQPDYYKATLNGPTTSGKYTLVLTSFFYGAVIDYKYSLTRNGETLSGFDKRKDLVTVSEIDDHGKGQVTLKIHSRKEGKLAMTCQAD